MPHSGGKPCTQVRGCGKVWLIWAKLRVLPKVFSRVFAFVSLTRPPLTLPWGGYDSHNVVEVRLSLKTDLATHFVEMLFWRVISNEHAWGLSVILRISTSSEKDACVFFSGSPIVFRRRLQSAQSVEAYFFTRRWVIEWVRWGSLSLIVLQKVSFAPWTGWPIGNRS